jgi:hypothetical protein
MTGLCAEVFKIVRRDSSGDLRSACITQPNAWVRYQPGEWTVPDFGPLFAFDSYTAAADFFRLGQDFMPWQLWSADAEDVRPRTEVLDNRKCLSSHMRAYWAGEMVTQPRILTPLGTVACSRLKLKELLYANV